MKLFFCFGCHQQEQRLCYPMSRWMLRNGQMGLTIHATYDEWRNESRHSQEETACQFCHMQSVMVGANATDLGTVEDPKYHLPGCART